VEPSKPNGAKVNPSPATPHGRRQSLKETKKSSAPFPEVAPFPDPVVPREVLDEIVAIILRHVVMDRELAIAAALWIAMTWLIDVIEVAPIAIITAPEKACGKSQLLTIFNYLVRRPLQAANTTASFLFRAIEAWRPTILIDEADTFIRGNDELKGLVNAGHTRAGAFVGRTVSVGDGHEPRLFDVWGAKAFAGISLEKHLPDATMSRGIVFGLRRKLPDETVTRLRHADRAIFETLASKLARFALDSAEQVCNARPPLPDELSDREQDNMEPLLAIAECAGPDWLAKATAAALKLSKGDHVVVSTGNELLADIQAVFAGNQVTKISTVDLIA
jgi:putative DNA primase/helicase